MPQFMLIYKGQATNMDDMTPEQGQVVMQKWMTWLTRVGSSLADAGYPFGASSSLVDDGSPGTAAALTGYSVVEAADMDAARDLADGHPFISESTGHFAIDIYEVLPRPFEPPAA